MPRFLPFPALRYGADDLDAVTAPPYDVLSEAEVGAFAARSEHNIVRVDVPRGGPERYERAAAVLRQWRADGVLVADREPTFTLYRMRFADATGAIRVIAGVLGGLEVVDDGAGGVLPHERTTPKDSTDRLDLTRATATNLSPVWGLSLASGLAQLLAAPGELLGTVTGGGVEHRVERVADADRVAAVAAAVGSADVLIADGHHRYAVSRTYRDEVRAATGRHDSAAEETLTFVQELVADQLSVAAIHRLYAGVSLDDLIRALQPWFALEPTPFPDAATLAAMEEHGFLVLVGPDVAWRLIPRQAVFDGARALDGAWLELALDGSNATVTYQHGLAETLDAVTTGAASAAVLIRPVSVAEIRRTALEGLLMPPKSTFFTPKLKTGLVLRPLA
ncbi:DUF1015 family protein [uncultured Friedmanniella sp.]|uniref:DUF1015 family protein n=1 Tax=uncultured Friedmanniella sp. TaxID=335381 RepID=UPI0035CBFF0B